MPATVADEQTRRVSLRDLAEMLNRTPAAVSQAAHRKHFCKGYPVFKWAEWHPAGNQIRFYMVPTYVLRDLVPPEEYDRWGL